MRELKLATLDESRVNRFKNWSRRITGTFQALFVVTRAAGESSESSENFESHFIEAKRFSTPCYGLSLDKETWYSFVHFESLLHVKFQRAFTSNIKAKVTARSTEYL